MFFFFRTVVYLGNLSLVIPVFSSLKWEIMTPQQKELSTVIGRSRWLINGKVIVNSENDTGFKSDRLEFRSQLHHDRLHDLRQVHCLL